MAGADTNGRTLSFRFDVDTRACIDRGIPNLAVLAMETGTAFTFFVTMGRAVLRSRQLASLVHVLVPRASSRKHVKLSAMRKLGPAEFAKTGVFNPRIGGSRVALLRVLHCAGHELALHGGSNHEAWQRFAHLWSQRRVRKEIEYGWSALRRIIGRAPAGFASPGWNGSQAINLELERFGFRYVADSVARNDETVQRLGRLLSVPTNIVGEPPRVGYLENLRARGLSDGEILADFAGQLEAIKAFGVVYDHPFYAGVAEIPTLRAMIGIARDIGFEICTIERAMDRMGAT